MDIPKQIIAFCHFKGGVGTSFIASNVALELAKNKILTCLIDFDTKLPNCANILGIEIKKKDSLYRYFSKNGYENRGQYFIVDKNITPYLYVISTSSEDEVEILEDINDSENQIEELLNVAKESFDIVIVDLPIDYLNPQVVETIQKADKVMVVGDLDINAVENTFRSLEMYKSIDIPLAKFSYILNKNFPNSDITANTIQETLGIRIGATIPMDYQPVFESIIRSKPITNTKHKIANYIQDICGLITGHITFTDTTSTSEGEPKVTISNPEKEDVAATKFTLVFDEEGEKVNGNS